MITLHTCLLLLTLSADTDASPAQISIQKAEAGIAKNPGHVPYHNALAMAYARRAREISDDTYYGKAEEVVEKTLQKAPGDFETLKVRCWLLLGRHEFAKARELAMTLNKKNPDDITVYGFLTDANVELGNYKEAIDAAQWMLKIRPGNVAGLTRAAYLRELHGYLPGAIELMRTAYDAVAYPETEERAWILTQIANLQLTSGNLAEAEKYATGALGVFPGYHYALAAMGRVRTAQKRYADAAEFYQKRYDASQHPENLYPLGLAYRRAGKDAEAERVFAQFEKEAVEESGGADNANHELIAYYIEVAKRPAEAVKIAEAELKRRNDVFTQDAYAWAKAAAGDYAEADKHLQSALAVGVKDPSILYHASVVAKKQNRMEEADKLLRQAAAGYCPEAVR
ncbi:hypothetical protein F183_A17970 [Bryobacterales bacterium F-183]|nr:hypothetical protein F183_A17970 [Bryobacterales bacterium F-183]